MAPMQTLREIILDKKHSLSVHISGKIVVGLSFNYSSCIYNELRIVTRPLEKDFKLKIIVKLLLSCKIEYYLSQ